MRALDDFSTQRAVLLRCLFCVRRQGHSMGWTFDQSCTYVDGTNVETSIRDHLFSGLELTGNRSDFNKDGTELNSAYESIYQLSIDNKHLHIFLRILLSLLEYAILSHLQSLKKILKLVLVLTISLKKYRQPPI